MIYIRIENIQLIYLSYTEHFRCVPVKITEDAQANTFIGGVIKIQSVQILCKLYSNKSIVFSNIRKFSLRSLVLLVSRETLVA
jgi:hypothetical protein